MVADPRDSGSPGKKEWEEFRASYAAARLFSWLLGDLDEIAPDYVDDLRERINNGISMGELLAEEDHEYDRAAIIHSPVRREAHFIDYEDAILLEDQLFPHRRASDDRDFKQAMHGLALVAFHSALESYVNAVGADRRRTPLPKAVGGFLVARGRKFELEESLADAFTVFDETRHLVIHNRGTVSDRYADNVKYNTLQVGELRVISARDLDDFSATAWRIASKLHTACA